MWYFINYKPEEKTLSYSTIDPWSMKAISSGDKYHNFKIGEKYDFSPIIDFK